MINAKRNIRRHRVGFTLVEIVIVIAIVAILAAVAVPHFQAMRERSQRRACYANLRTIVGALEWYSADHNIDYQLLSDADFEPLVEGGYLQVMPQCPAEGLEQYTCLGGNEPAVCAYHGTIHPTTEAP